MDNKKITGVFAISLIALFSISLVAAQGFGFNRMSDEDQELFLDEREVMRTAIENEDYSTWKSLMEDRIARMQESLTEDDFKELVANHENNILARENGEFENNFQKRMNHFQARNLVE